mmetsp:Transcript_36288/g.49508  ORF Transcript_36288/g.49508 Transcript_36288/m.49508 type:complete len:82 (+) Transcript_36288:37-282(+)
MSEREKTGGLHKTCQPTWPQPSYFDLKRQVTALSEAGLLDYSLTSVQSPVTLSEVNVVWMFCGVCLFRTGMPMPWHGNQLA